MADKNLKLNFKINIDAAGKAELANLTKDAEKGLDNVNAKTKLLTELENKKKFLLEEQVALQEKVKAAIERQNAAIQKNSSYQNLAVANVDKLLEKHNRLNAALNTELATLARLANASNAYNMSFASRNVGANTNTESTEERQAKLKEARLAREQAVLQSALDRQQAIKQANLNREQALIQSFNAATERIERNAANRRIAITQEEVNARQAAIARLSSFGTRMASGSAGSSMIGGMTASARASTTPSPIANTSEVVNANTAALNRNRAALTSTTAAHTSLFVRVGEAIGAYRIWNSVISLTQQALLSIPQAGIQQQQALSSIYAIFGTEEGNKNLAFLKDLAQSAGQYIGDLQEAYRKFAPSAMLAGAKQAEVNQIFEDFTKVSTVLHFSTDQVKSLYLAIEQMYAKTTVQSEEIKKQLGNVLPGAVEIGAKAWASYSKSADKSVSAFMDAMKKNLVVTREFAPAFAKEYEAVFGGKVDSIFLDASTKLLSNINRVRTAARDVSVDLYDMTAEAMNNVVKLAANSLDKIQENLQGVVQVIEAIAIVIGTSLTISFAKFMASARGLAILGAVFNPIVIGVAAVGAGIGALALRNTDMTVSYNKFTHASKDQVDALMATYVAQGEGAQQALDELDRLSEKSNSFSIDYKGMQIELSSVMVAVGELISEFWDYIKSVAKVAMDDITSMFKDKMPKAVVSIFDAIKASVKDLAEQSGLNSLLATLDNLGTKVLDKAKVIQEASNKEYQKNLPPRFEGIGKGNVNEPLGKPDKGAAAAAKKELLNLYKDLERELKLLKEQTDTAIAGLDNSYAGNLLSIKEYYTKKEQEQRIYIDNQKNLYAMELKIALAYKDATKAEQIKDKVDVLNEQAKQISPVIDKAQASDLKTFNDTLAQSNIQYLQLAGATVAAAVAQEQLNTAKRRAELAPEIKAGGATAPAAKQELQQLDTSAAITKINATAAAAQSYRDKINEIQSAYTAMGATSNDVLSATLGGYAPLLNLFDNFMAKQTEMIAKMTDLKAEAERLSEIKVISGFNDPTAEMKGAKEARDANQNDIIVNAKQQEVLDKKATADKINNITNVFAIGEKMSTKGSKTQQTLHKATMVMNGIEFAYKVTMMAMDAAASAKKLAANAKEMASDLMALPGKLANGAAELVKQSGWAGFAGIAILLALVGGIVGMSFGGGGGGGGGEPAPSNAPTGQGGVLGDTQAVSESIGHTNDLLTNIHADEYIELKGINKGIQTLQGNILKAITKQFQLGAIQGTNAPKLGQSGYTVVAGGIHTENIAISDLIKKMDIVGDMFITTAKKGGTKEKPTFSYKDTYSEMPKALHDSLSDVFQSISLTITELGAKLGKNIGKDLSNKVNAAIIPGLKIDTLGLSGDEAVKKANAVISANLDEVTSFLFGDIVAKYQELGEGMLETTARIVEQVAVVRVAYEAVGSKLIKDSIAISDALINASSSALKASDRIDEFLKQENAFYSSFTSDVTKNIDVLKQFSMTLTEVFDVGLTKATSAIVNTAPDKAYAKSKATYKKDFDRSGSGAAKGTGFLGEVKVPNTKGMVATEYTTGVSIKGIQIEVPTLIPTLTKLEKASLLLAISKDKMPSDSIIAKATIFATDRLSKGLSVFAKNPMPVYSQYTASGKLGKEDLAAYKGGLKERATEAKITYALSSTPANLKAYTKAQEEYDYVLAYNRPKLKSLSETFFDTYKSTGSLTATISKLKTQIDLTTPAGIKAFAAINKIKDAFSSLIDKIQKPIKDAIDSIKDDSSTLTKDQLLTKLNRASSYEDIKKYSDATLKLIVDKYNVEKGLLTSLKTSITSTLATIKEKLNPNSEADLKTKVIDKTINATELTTLVKLITDRYTLERGYITGIQDMLKSNAAIIVDSMDIETEKGLLEKYNSAKANGDLKLQASTSAKLQKLIMDKFTAEKNSILSIKKSFVDLSKTVKDLLAGALSILNPKEKLDLAKAEYDTLKAQTQSKDLTVAAEAASKLGDASSKYLTEALSYYGATANYNQIFQEVTGSLTAISASSMATDAGSLEAIKTLGSGALMELATLGGIGALGLETLGVDALQSIADLGTGTAATLFDTSEASITALSGIGTSISGSVLKSVTDLSNGFIAQLATLDTNTYNDLKDLGVASENLLITLSNAAIQELGVLGTNVTNAIIDMIAMANLRSSSAATVITAQGVPTPARTAAEKQIIAHSPIDLAVAEAVFASTGNSKQATTAYGQADTLQSQLDKIAIQIADFKNNVKWNGKPVTKAIIDKTLTSIISSLGTVGNAALFKKQLGAIKLPSGVTLLKTAQTRKVPGYANGGIASGLSLVGERGPELINFPNSTRVSNNNRTNSILKDSNKESLNILTDMKKELIILNNRMETIERKTRLTKPTMSMA